MRINPHTDCAPAIRLSAPPHRLSLSGGERSYSNDGSPFATEPSQSIICVEMMPPTTHATLPLGEGGTHPLQPGNLYNNITDAPPVLLFKLRVTPCICKFWRIFSPKTVNSGWDSQCIEYSWQFGFIKKVWPFFSIENICWHLVGVPCKYDYPDYCDSCLTVERADRGGVDDKKTCLGLTCCPGTTAGAGAGDEEPGPEQPPHVHDEDVPLLITS